MSVCPTKWTEITAVHRWTVPPPVTVKSVSHWFHQPYPAALLSSLGIHILLALAVTYGLKVTPFKMAEETRIAVTLVTPFGSRRTAPPQKTTQEGPTRPDDQPASSPTQHDGKYTDRLTPAPKTSSVLARVPPGGSSVDGRQTMIRATRLYSHEIWSNPKNREAKHLLGRLALPERMEQICNNEAMEQVHAWKETLSPDWMIAYALSEPEVRGSVILAEGAVFRSRGRWFHLKYECTLSDDFSSVTDMAFLVGRPVPKRDWKRLNFPTR